MTSSVFGRFAWAGVAAGMLYTAVVLVGGAVTPGYDHIGEHVSSLYQVGAPLALPIAVAFSAYNALVTLFGLSIAAGTRALGGVRTRVGIAAGVAVVLTGFAGFADCIFQQDPIGTTITTAGTLHIVFAGVASLFTILAIGLFLVWAWTRRGMRGFSWYSVITLVVISISGPLTATATANLWPTMGLLERVPIFGFIQWLVVCSAVWATDGLASRRTAPADRALQERA